MTTVERATLTISSKRDELFLYQTIKITPENRSKTRFFFEDRYKAAREVNELLRTLYMGDGKGIFFVEKQKFRNQLLIKYRIDTQDEIDLSEKKFNIKAEVPDLDGCDNCSWFRLSTQGKDRCQYYREFLPKKKIYCSDFDEK